MMQSVLKLVSKPDFKSGVVYSSLKTQISITIWKF